MNVIKNEKEKFYKLIGLGTHTERGKFLKWSSGAVIDRRSTFIIDVPNTALPPPRLGVY